MTLAIAWVRTTASSPELVFASDSRLRFGCAWDCCQKVFPLPRGDCAVMFAGDTHYAYPFVHTAINAVSLHRKSARRVVDLVEAAPILLRSINGMWQDISDLPRGRETAEPELRLILGGYSWRRKRFLMWRYRFDATARRFLVSRVGLWRGLGENRRIAIIGYPDASPSAQRRAQRQARSAPSPEEDVERMARSRLVHLLTERGIKDGSGLDMEPLEVLRDMIRAEDSPHVGGPPQVVKVYQHLNNQVFGVLWPDATARPAVLGRSLPQGEVMHVPVIDPDTVKVIAQRSLVRPPAV